MNETETYLAFKNRLIKRERHLRKWAKRTESDCYRLYDREIKAYPLTIDFYAGRFLIQYFSTRGEDDPRPDLQKETENALITLFQIKPEQIFSRVRIKRTKLQQYEKMDQREERFVVKEYGVKFYVNLHDYLDTGLFLDHRETRQIVAKLANGKRLLNLFAYTCSFSVHAALKGALFTKSVDLSNTYTTWGADNFLLNHLSLKNHQIIRADCQPFLQSEKEKYDLIVVDPPTLSRSKSMEGFFDIQRDYLLLLKRALQLLLPGGTLFFSTNSRSFSFDSTQLDGYVVKEITAKTIPLDFHNQKIHRCWRISHL